MVARLRHRGQDPAHGGKAAQKRGKRVTQESQRRAAWNGLHQQQEQNPQVFKREILPHLREMPLGKIARVTGLSRGYCSFIRRGVRIPHPRHWNILRDLARQGNK